MPRYFFHFQDGPARLTDCDGIALPDSEAAWYQGVRSARDIIDQDVEGDAIRLGRRMDVLDEGGMQVWAMPFEDLESLAV